MAMSLLLPTLLALSAQESRLPTEVELDAAVLWIKPKFRFRDGAPNLKGTDVRSQEIGGDNPELGWAAQAKVQLHSEILHAQAWQVEATGSGTLQKETAWGGQIFPAGTPSRFEVDFVHAEIGYRHRFEVSKEVFWFDVGLDVEFLQVDADMEFGKTELSGFYWTPQTMFTVEPWRGIQFWFVLGGFAVATIKGNHAVLEPIDFGVGARLKLGSFAVEAGWSMVHVHIEERMGDIDEDVVHTRLRGWHASVEYRF